MTGASNSAEGLTQTGLPSRALLWLFAGFALLLTPQLDRLPVWLVAACLVLAFWRGLAQSGRGAPTQSLVTDRHYAGTRGGLRDHGAGDDLPSIRHRRFSSWR